MVTMHDPPSFWSLLLLSRGPRLEHQSTLLLLKLYLTFAVLKWHCLVIPGITKREVTDDYIYNLWS